MEGYDGTSGPSGWAAALVGLFLGLSAALLLYVWQHSEQQAAAAFIIVGYTAWLSVVTRHAAAWDHARREALRTLRANSRSRRVARMASDPRFWWSVVFGMSTMVTSLWYSGLTDMRLLAGLAAAWCMIAVSMNYGATLQLPTTRCRRCGYDLISHLHIAGADDAITCPECGTRTSRRSFAVCDLKAVRALTR